MENKRPVNKRPIAKKKKKKKNKIKRVATLCVFLFITVGLSVTFINLFALSEDGSSITKDSEESKVLDTSNYEKKYVTEYTKYGESLNLEYDDTYAHELTFTNIDTEESILITTTDYVDQGANLIVLGTGTWYVTTEDGSILDIEDAINYTYYSVTRDDSNFRYDITNSNGYLEFDISVDTLPADYYDIIIDPGHGGIDGGAESVDANVTEADINLEVAFMMQDTLEEQGYKVLLTRTEDINPGNLEGITSVGADSRTSYAYDYNASFFFSIHHNTGGGSGYEIYTTTQGSTDFADIITDNLSTFSSPSTNTFMGYISPGVYQYSIGESNEVIDDYDDQTIDYFYIIRETGGVSTTALSDENIYQDNLAATQTILLEFGYIDNYTDYYTLIDDDFQQQEVDAVVSSLNTYLEVDEPSVIDETDEQ